MIEVHKRIPRSMSHAARFLLGSLMTPLRSGNVVMFHIGRCGSTVLCDLLKQHPRVYWDGEVYHRFRGTSRPRHGPRTFLRLRMPLARSRFYGFEFNFLRAKHLRHVDCDLAEYVELLRDLGFEHFLILKRRNHLRRVVSAMIGHMTKRWFRRGEEEPVPTSVDINVRSVGVDSRTIPLLDLLHEYDAAYRTLEGLLGGRRTMSLEYESHVADDPRVGYSAICEFLGLECPAARVRYQRTNPFKLAELIANFKDVERALEGTQHEWMLYA